MENKNVPPSKTGKNVRPFEYIAPFTEALVYASNRSRTILLILSTASVLAFVGVWNSKPTTWMHSRINGLANELQYLKGRKAIRELEREVSTLPTDCATLPSANDGSVPRTNSNTNSQPSRANANVAPAVSEAGSANSNKQSGTSGECKERFEKTAEVERLRNYFVNSSTYMDFRKYFEMKESRDQIKFFEGESDVILDTTILETEENLKSALRLRRENILVIKVPFFGSSFDINDLSLISGLTFTIILIWLRLSFWTELNATQQVFERIDDADLKNVYEYLGTNLVFTIPKSQDARLRRFGEKPWKSIVKLLIVAPAAVQLAVLGNDVYTAPIGLHIDVNNTILVLIAGFFFLALTIVLTASCLSLASTINSLWDTQGDKAEKLSDTPDIDGE